MYMKMNSSSWTSSSPEPYFTETEGEPTYLKVRFGILLFISLLQRERNRMKAETIISGIKTFMKSSKSMRFSIQLYVVKMPIGLSPTSATSKLRNRQNSQFQYLWSIRFTTHRYVLLILVTESVFGFKVTHFRSLVFCHVRLISFQNYGWTFSSLILLLTYHQERRGKALPFWNTFV